MFLAFAGSVAAPYVPVAVVPWLQLIPAFDTMIMAVLLLLTLLCAVAKCNPTRLTLFLIAYMLLVVLRNFETPVFWAAGKPQTGRELTLLSLNVQQFGNDTQRVNKIVELIRERDPDVLCLQEFGLYYKWPDVQSLATDFSRRTALPFHDFTPADGNIFGTAVFSKYPLTPAETVFQLVSHTNEAKVYRLVVDRDTITVCNAHLQSFNFTNYQRPGALPLAQVVEMQQEQAGEIIRHLASEPGAVLAGDLNVVPGSAVHRLFSRHFSDAQSTANSGWIPTHHFLPVRIDYVFSAPSIRVSAVRVIGDFPTDHRAVEARLRW